MYNNRFQIETLQCTITSCNITPLSQTVTQGATALLTLTWTGGTPPYSADWYNENGYWTTTTTTSGNTFYLYISTSSNAWSPQGAFPVSMPLGKHYFFVNVHCPNQPSCRAPGGNGAATVTVNAPVLCSNPIYSLGVS